MDRFAAMRRLLSPKTAAFIGGNGAAAAIRQTRDVGFDGTIWAVNPNRETLADVPCHASLADLPEAPDSAFIAAPPAASIEIVRELSAMGAGGAVCYASGFAELGGDGRRLQDELREAAGSMPVVGPNCHGFVNYLDGVALWPDEHGGERVKQGIALITQSGNFGINLSMQRRGLDFAYVITVGNRTCISLDEYIEYLLTDERVKAIGLHVEGIDRVHEFSQAAIKALEAGVPIVAIKTGRSAKGARLNMSHTASLAGEDRLYDALFERVGVARANTVPQLLETLKFVSTVGALPGNTVGSMSCSGGEASLVADAADALGLEMPALSKVSHERLFQVLGPMVPLSNPLDYHTFIWAQEERLVETFSAMMEAGFDLTCLVIDFPREDRCLSRDWEITTRAFARAAKESGARGALVASLAESLPERVAAEMTGEGVASFGGFEEALLAAEAAADIGEAWSRPEPQLAGIPPLMDGTARSLSEWSAKRLLARQGLPLPEGGLAASAAEAVAMAEELGYPLVVKAVAEDLSHKSELGAVRLNLADADQLHVGQGVVVVGPRLPGYAEHLEPGRGLVEALAARRLLGIEEAVEAEDALHAEVGVLVVKQIEEDHQPRQDEDTPDEPVHVARIVGPAFPFLVHG